MLAGKEIVLGVTGGIAAYKAAELVRQMVKLQANVHVVMTRNATEFVTPLTFQTVSMNKVSTDTFDLISEARVGHISLADRAHLMVIAPATANIIAKIANGIADDMLTSVIIATSSPILIAPAMHTNMWNNPITQRNVAKLKSLGYYFVGPGKGELASGDVGEGRLVDVGEILNDVRMILSQKDLKGEKLLVTAGPTREPLDPVRYISNRSSGKMGYCIAREAHRRGAKVVLVSGPTRLLEPRGVKLIRVETALQMKEAVLHNLETSTVIIKAAAVSDYKAKEIAEEKIKKDRLGMILDLEKNHDILFELGQVKGEKFLVGFAAETEDLITYAKKKIEGKHLDLIIANDVSKPNVGFDYDTNEVKIIDKDGSIEELPMMSKEKVAVRIIDRIVQALGKGKTRR